MNVDVVDLTEEVESKPSTSRNLQRGVSIGTGAASTSGVNARLSTALSEVDVELTAIDAEIERLRVKKRQLVKRREDLLGQVAAANVDYRDIEERWDSAKCAWSDKLEVVLKETFKLDSFRPLQRAAINAVLSGEDVIVIMSTGAGKSLCYQLPPLVANGFALVVSPLISLVEDQLIQLKKLGIYAASLNHSTGKEEAKEIDAAILDPSKSFRLLYVTPEKLAKSKRLMNKLEKAVEKGRMKLIAVDEVHCCSQWGHDFRTDYKFLNVLKRQFKGVPLIGLTATATGNVLEDVKKMLGIEAAVILRAGFNRPNLRYEVEEKPKGDMGLAIAEIIKKRFPSQSGIVYCLSRKDCEVVAQTLKGEGIKAHFYHAYIDPERKSMVHEKWLSGACQVIVATVAFGMGIDKPNVRFVIHHSIAKSVENYYQEAGRAGRDGQPAACILMYRLADVFRQSVNVCTDQMGQQKLYEMVEYAANGITCRRVTLAALFGEDWENNWCQSSCDVCSKEANGEMLPEEVDLSAELRLAVEIIDETRRSTSDGSSNRVTGAKLIELMSKRCKKSIPFLEAALTQMILSSMLTEDFHFTPYSILSYIVKGRAYDMWLKNENSFKRKLRRLEKNDCSTRKRKIVDRI